jgi:hypothetical protein
MLHVQRGVATFPGYVAPALPVSNACLTPPVGIPVLVGAVSRKVHGTAGTFDLPVNLAPVAPAITVEPRAIGAGHVIVLQFDRAITIPGTLTVLDQNVNPVATASLMPVGTTVQFTIPALANGSRISLGLSDVNGPGVGTAGASLGFLVGDTNASRGVDGTDVLDTRMRSGQRTDGTNFLFDSSASGFIGASDILAAKARLATLLH